ncbi:right-handed parallel beta-helix repeat-containing protein [archaeon]|nr:right-handed parallel beta-helix repeat-containing protein [archaeon]
MTKNFLIVVVLLLTTLYFVGSVTRSISDSMDNKETLIRNSNGNYWEPSETNSQVEIQAAIDDVAASGGGTVWLPPGLFEITYPIYLDDNIRFVGSGTGNTMLRTKNGMNPASQPSAGTVRYVILVRGKSEVTISDMTIDANLQNNPGDGECIRFDQGTSDFVLERVHLLNARDSALYLGQLNNGMVSNIYIQNVQEWHGFAMTSIYNSTFSDVIMEGIDDGYALDLHAVHNCNFNNFVTESFWGIKMVDYQSSNNNFNNFYIHVLDSSDGHYGLKLYTIQDSNFNNIRITGSETGLLCGMDCFNNNFNNILISSPSDTGIHLDDSENLSFSNIQIQDSVNWGLLGSSPKQVSLSNIQIKGGTHGIRLWGAEKVSLSDSKVSDTGEYGIYLRDVSDIMIKNSIVTNSGSKGIYVSGNDPSSDYIISDCIINGATNQGIQIADTQSEHFIITNNVVVNTGSTPIQDASTTTNKIVLDNLT